MAGSVLEVVGLHFKDHVSKRYRLLFKYMIAALTLRCVPRKLLFKLCARKTDRQHGASAMLVLGDLASPANHKAKPRSSAAKVTNGMRVKLIFDKVHAVL